MQIVIDISKQDYVYIVKKHCLPSCDDNTLRKIFYEMISSGTPLPKGHGRLIDADSLKEKTYRIYSRDYEYDEVVNADDINDAPTIIEAEWLKDYKRLNELEIETPVERYDIK